MRGKLRTFETRGRGGCSYYDGSTRSPWVYISSDLADYWLVNDFVTREEPSGAVVVGRFSFDWKAAVQQLDRQVAGAERRHRRCHPTSRRRRRASRGAQRLAGRRG